MTTLTWTPDLLGPSFQQAILPLGPDPDHEPPHRVQAVLVRYCEPIPTPRDTAILYVHGMSDYFFHTHLATHFATHGLRTYGIDLRKCGRAHLPHQTWHHATDLTLYDADLTAALSAIPETNVIVIAHSTGGLIVAGWLSRLAARHRADRALHDRIRGVILNSPWIDLQVPPTQQKLVRAAARTLRLLPIDLPMPLKNNPTYGHTLHSDYNGTWNYNLTYKPLAGQPKKMSWFNAILDAQHQLHTGQLNMHLPTLVLCSSASAATTPSGQRYDPARVDIVLDTQQIQDRAPLLSDPGLTTVTPIPGAIHDVYLSQPDALAQALTATDRFIDSLTYTPAGRRE